MDIYQILLQVLILKLQTPPSPTKNIHKHTQVTVTGKHKEVFLYFHHCFAALFNQNYFFYYHNFSKAKVKCCDISARCHGEMEKNQMKT